MILAALLSLLTAGPPLVGVMPPESPATLGLEEKAAQAAVHDAVTRVGRVRTMAANALTRLIASAAESGIACDPARGDCATRIGAFGALDFVVVTRLAGVKDATRATLILLDCADGREVRTVSALLGADADEARAGLQALALAVLAEGKAEGRLRVEAPADGVIVIDGVDRGRAPLAVAVDAGVHEVAFRSDAGAPVVTKSIEVPAAALATMSFAPVTSAPAAASAPLSITAGAIAVTGAVVAVAGGVGVVVTSPSRDTRARYTAQQYNDAVGLGRALLVVSAVGVVLASVGVALLASAGGAGDDEGPP